MSENGSSNFSLLSVLLGLALGGATGLGVYTFVYARGLSYLSDDPAACANCHVMQPWLDAWMKSSHHAVATCNDCHTPASTVGKYYTKALNGYHHSLAFTLGDFPDVILVTPRNHLVAERSCARCHASLVEDVQALSENPAPTCSHQEPDQPCTRCHGSVGHPL